MRGLVIEESLRTSVVPDGIKNNMTRRYKHSLDGDRSITIWEFQLVPELVNEIAFELASLLTSDGFYAHLLDDYRMYVVYPRVVAIIERGSLADERVAQAIGSLFNIPQRQMMFQAMFETDHPDAPADAE